MLETFEPGTLPGEKPGLHYLSNDVASFGEIWQAADQSEMECVWRQHALGWFPVGELRTLHSGYSCTSLATFLMAQVITDTHPRKKKGQAESIGVFFWSAESYNNRNFREGGIPSLPSFGTGLMRPNTSTTMERLTE